MTRVLRWCRRFAREMWPMLTTTLVVVLVLDVAGIVGWWVPLAIGAVAALVFEGPRQYVLHRRRMKAIEFWSHVSISRDGSEIRIGLPLEAGTVTVSVEDVDGEGYAVGWYGLEVGGHVARVRRGPGDSPSLTASRLVAELEQLGARVDRP